MRHVSEGSVAMIGLVNHSDALALKRFWLRENRKIFNGARTLRTLRTHTFKNKFSFLDKICLSFVYNRNKKYGSKKGDIYVRCNNW